MKNIFSFSTLDHKHTKKYANIILLRIYQKMQNVTVISHGELFIIQIFKICLVVYTSRMNLVINMYALGQISFYSFILHVY